MFLLKFNEVTKKVLRVNNVCVEKEIATYSIFLFLCTNLTTHYSVGRFFYCYGLVLSPSLQYLIVIY